LDGSATGTFGPSQRRLGLSGETCRTENTNRGAGTLFSLNTLRESYRALSGLRLSRTLGGSCDLLSDALTKCALPRGRLDALRERADALGKVLGCLCFPASSRGRDATLSTSSDPRSSLASNRGKSSTLGIDRGTRTEFNDLGYAGRTLGNLRRRFGRLGASRETERTQSERCDSGTISAARSVRDRAISEDGRARTKFDDLAEGNSTLSENRRAFGCLEAA
jgi:hypothetical protein